MFFEPGKKKKAKAMAPPGEKQFYPINHQVLKSAQLMRASEAVQLFPHRTSENPNSTQSRVTLKQYTQQQHFLTGLHFCWGMEKFKPSDNLHQESTKEDVQDESLECGIKTSSKFF